MPKGWKNWHTIWKYRWQQVELLELRHNECARGSSRGFHGGTWGPWNDSGSMKGTPVNVLWRDLCSTEGLWLMFHGRTPTQNFCPSCMLGPTTYPDLRNNFVTRRRKVWQFNCHLRKLKIYNKLSFSTPPTAVNPGTTIIAIFFSSTLQWQWSTKIFIRLR